MEEIEIGDWVKVMGVDGLCRLREVTEVEDGFIGFGIFGFTFKNRVLEVRKKNNGNKEENKDNKSEANSEV